MTNMLSAGCRRTDRPAPAGNAAARAAVLLAMLAFGLAAVPAAFSQAATTTTTIAPVEGSKGTPAPAGEKDVITFSSRRVESILTKGKERTVLSGNARVLTGSMEITAERVELTGADYQFMTCTGTVVVTDTKEKFVLKTPSLSYDRETKITIADGESELQDDKNGVILKAGWIRFDQKNSLVNARQAVHILKEDFAVRSEFALFNRNDESLDLTGAPTAATPDGTVSADSITGQGGADNMQFTGEVSGTITTKKKEGTAQ